MYIRFVTPYHDVQSRTCAGIFRAYWQHWRDRAVAPDDWRVIELGRVVNWFNSHLDLPRRVGIRQGRKGAINGVCWFRPQARHCINNARYMAWLLTDLGTPVEEWRSEDPGTMLWQDAQQIVAIPPKIVN